MMGVGLQSVTVLRALVEIAWMFLLAQGILFVMAGSGRDNNFVYRLFRAITRPVILAMRFVTPRAIVDRHIPFLAFFLLFWLWIMLAWLRLHV